MMASIKDQSDMPNAVQEIVQEIEQSDPFASTEHPKSSLKNQANQPNQAVLKDLNLDNPFEEIKQVPRSIGSFKNLSHSYDSNVVTRKKT